jgi:hypothetical protein
MSATHIMTPYVMKGPLHYERPLTFQKPPFVPKCWMFFKWFTFHLDIYDISKLWWLSDIWCIRHGPWGSGTFILWGIATLCFEPWDPMLLHCLAAHCMIIPGTFMIPGAGTIWAAGFHTDTIIAICPLWTWKLRIARLLNSGRDCLAFPASIVASHVPVKDSVIYNHHEEKGQLSYIK